MITNSNENLMVKKEFHVYVDLPDVKDSLINGFPLEPQIIAYDCIENILSISILHS
jgi:hypothetical protein